MDLDTLEACLLQRKVEVSRAADILVAVHRVVAVCLIQCRGAFLIGVIHLALVRKEMAEPVILIAIFIDGLFDASGNRNLVVEKIWCYSYCTSNKQDNFNKLSFIVKQKRKKSILFSKYERNNFFLPILREMLTFGRA